MCSSIFFFVSSVSSVRRDFNVYDKNLSVINPYVIVLVALCRCVVDVHSLYKRLYFLFLL